MAIRVYDTLEQKKVELVPREPGKIRMYVCGPTTYNFIHLGNARPVVAFDVVARHLRARGLDVTYVRNITDVDDKIIRRAAELGEDFGSLTKRFTDEFHKDVGALCCLPPDVEPRVTTSMPEIIAIIEKLIARGVAYASSGDVYFSVGKYDGYGQLSHQPIADLQAGARVSADVGERKQAPLDFALWKGAKPGEPSWESPWGQGRPGWHIECSAMSARWLGTSFDLHGGGIDLAFPHHENERAQSMCANGEFARYWLHNGFVNFNGEKIAKSNEDQKALFNRAFRLRSLIEKHSGEAVRLFLLTTQYRNPINHEVVRAEDDDGALRFPALEEAERRLEYAYLTRERLAAASGSATGATISTDADSWIDRLREALDDDFNTAGALAEWSGALALANRILDGKIEMAKDVRKSTILRLAMDLERAAEELGVTEAPATEWLAAHRTRRAAARKIDAASVEARIAARADARKAKDFTRADEIRAELAAGGVEIMDTPKGTTWRVAD